MRNSVELNTIAFEHLFNALAHRLYDIFEERIIRNMPLLSAPASVTPALEKPMNRKEVKEHYGVSTPTLKKMVEAGKVKELEVEGVRGFRYLPSELNKAFKPVKR